MAGEMEQRVRGDAWGRHGEILRRWVEQPPAGPNVQYLRDAERTAALEQLGGRSPVLDVASESGLTAELTADHVTRVDFSREAADLARARLGRQVDRYETTTPWDPTLPFPDDAFEAAVCVGPYDWKFLDVEGLTAELHRTIRRDGLLVVSVPTPRSPYASTAKSRSYDPEAALELLSPDWLVDESTLLYQYPRRVHELINRLPPAVQERFAGLARWRSRDLTARGRWDAASYLVVGASPLDYEHYLSMGLESLFRPTARDGFWDEVEGRISRALQYEFVEGTPAWSPVDGRQWRYPPLALLGAMQWRTSSIGDGRHDASLRAELDYVTRCVDEAETRVQMPSYGIGPLIASLALAGQVFDDPGFITRAVDLYEYSADRFAFDHPEDALLLYGWTYLRDATPLKPLLSDIDDQLRRLNDRLTVDGLLGYEEPKSARHQNQMYSLWALCRAVEVTGSTGYLDVVERVLDYTIEHRMRDDGGIIWEDLPRRSRLRRTVEGRLTGRTPYFEYLFECHQTFFVNAIAHYYHAGGDRDYDRAAGRAMAWIYGENDLGVDLVEVSGIGVPMRHLTVGGDLADPYFVDGVRDQRYKGTYEVGSYVMALTRLLDGTFAD